MRMEPAELDITTDQDRLPERLPDSIPGTAPRTITAADVQSRASCEQLFVASLPLIHRVVAAIAAQRRLSPDEAEEFGAVVQLRIIKDDYAVFRKFQGRCTLRTFLGVVIPRMFLDYRDTQWGRWRPSARSRRDGELGILLEQLTIRDGLTFDEACTVLEATHAGPVDRPALADLYASLRRRVRRRRVNDCALEAIASPARSAEDGLLSAEREATLAGAAGELRAVLAQLGAEDHLIVKLRFLDGLPVSEIARVLHVDQKPLYGRICRVLRTMRQLLEARGVRAAEVLAALDGHHGSGSFATSRSSFRSMLCSRSAMSGCGRSAGATG
jgi:RNA polymerase sigma factor (sigma-70 family)